MRLHAGRIHLKIANNLEVAQLSNQFRIEVWHPPKKYIWKQPEKHISIKILINIELTIVFIKFWSERKCPFKMQLSPQF